MSEFEVHVERQIVFDGGYRVWLFQRVGESRTVLITHDGRVAEITGGANPDRDDYFCLLPRGAAHPLFGALGRELGAVEHPEQLRRDFEQLRSRHDKLVDHLIENGKALTDVAWAKTVGRRG